MAVSTGQRIMVFKDMGLVAQVFDESTLQSLPGRMAVGHDLTPETTVASTTNPRWADQLATTGHSSWPPVGIPTGRLWAVPTGP